MPPPDFSRYVGIPFADHGRDFSGTDCYGVVVLFYREQFGIELPSYTEGYSDVFSVGETIKLVELESLANWTQLPLELAEPGDVLLFVIKGVPVHTAIYVGEEQGQKRILHTIDRVDTSIEHFKTYVTRFHSAWRHNERNPA